MSDTLEKLNAVFQEVFENDDMIITGTTTAADVEGWDSLMHVTLIINVESQFKIRFSSSEVAALNSVGELVDLIDGKLGAKE
jgi:acyl carrier protein